MNKEQHVKRGDFVKVHFTGKLEDGTVFDSSKDDSPLKFKVGNGDVIEGFDQAIIGMKINQEKTIYINSDKAYGPLEKEFIISVAKENLPKKLDLKVGNQLQIPGEDGSTLTVRVTKITNETIELDGNHPLAGKNLIFNIMLIDIEEN